eukprot:m.77001 g.77001  ORF g.77001 m.77001 type:complete len:289 (-) comp24964_c0_seq2:142-1008(-)
METSTPQRYQYLLGYASSAFSTSTAAAITCPLDVVKTRLQLEPQKTKISFIDTFRTIVRNEGFIALWRGSGIVIARAYVYGGLRLGSYAPVKDFISGSNSTSVNVLQKLMAGAIAGAFASGVTSPLELIKTRVQAHPNLGYSTQGAWSNVRSLVAGDTIFVLWKGASMSMARASVITASQCVGYEETKKYLTSKGYDASLASTHFLASVVTGFISTTLSNPFDVIKSYMYVDGRHGSAFEYARSLIKEQGPKSFLKGWSAAYVRSAPLTTLIFVFNEQIRSRLGVQGL